MMTKDTRVTFRNEQIPRCCGMRMLYDFELAAKGLWNSTRFGDLIRNLTMPTLLVNNVNNSRRPDLQYIQAAIEICEEHDIRYIATPSWINDIHPDTSCGAIIIFPNKTRLDERAHSWRTVDPECENRTYTNRL